jgi:hypothetical protein
MHGCKKTHEYRTCIEEIDGFGCRWFSVLSRGKGERDKKKSHLDRRAHKAHCGKEEWRAREVLAGLRKEHREGHWLRSD